jgi:hypothetical protein
LIDAFRSSKLLKNPIVNPAVEINPELFVLFFANKEIFIANKEIIKRNAVFFIIPLCF